MARLEMLTSGIRALRAGYTGTPVVFLSGWPQTAEAFLPLFPHLSSRFQLYALDPPGLGHSSAPATNDYSTANISNILHESITSTIHTPFHLVSHDIGAWIAFSWASRYPSDILSLSLFDSAVPGLGIKFQYPLPSQLNIKLWQFSFNALPDLPEILTEGRERQLLDWLFDKKAVHPTRITREVRDKYVEAYSSPGAMTRGFEYYRAVARSAEQNVAFAGENGKLKVPVLALGGSTGVGGTLKTNMQGLVDGEVEGGVVEDCGHYVMEEQPDVVGKRLTDFLELVESGT